MNILLPVDGSPCSLRAVEYLIRHVAWFKEMPRIHLLHVHLPIPVGRVQAHVGHGTVETYYREESLARMAEAKGHLDAAGLAHTDHIHVGQPEEIIAKLARELDCDLVVMGTHGHGAMVNLVTGSVTTKVLQLSPVPVLLAK